MSTAVKFASFALLLVAVFGVGLAIGSAAGPVGVASVQQEQEPENEMRGGDMSDEEMSR
ncbi:MAG: hypothetical protein ACOYXW_03310 [Actinomycetota bacterium]